MGFEAHRERIVAELRARIERVPAGGRARAALPFGVPAIDGHLPGGGLLLGSLHEVTEAGPGAEHIAAATLFTAGILARLKGPVLWCLRSRDLFAPGLAGIGLAPGRVIYAETGREADVLPAMEEGLRHPGLAGVVGEVARLPLTPSRRLQLAAEQSGVVALVLHRPRVPTEAEPTAAVTRWRIAALPSARLAVPGIGRARWRIELLRCRGAEAAAWDLEACDAKGRLALFAALSDRPAAPGRHRTERGRAAAG